MYPKASSRVEGAIPLFNSGPSIASGLTLEAKTCPVGLVDASLEQSRPPNELPPPTPPEVPQPDVPETPPVTPPERPPFIPPEVPPELPQGFKSFNEGASEARDRTIVHLAA